MSASNNNNNWITLDQLRQSDRAENTENAHKDASKKYTQICALPKEQRRLGLGTDYSPSTEDGHCLLREEMIDDGLSEYFTYYFDVFIQSDEYHPYSTLRK